MIFETWDWDKKAQKYTLTMAASFGAAGLEEDEDVFKQIRHVMTTWKKEQDEAGQ